MSFAFKTSVGKAFFSNGSWCSIFSFFYENYQQSNKEIYLFLAWGFFQSCISSDYTAWWSPDQYFMAMWSFLERNYEIDWTICKICDDNDEADALLSFYLF